MTAFTPTRPVTLKTKNGPRIFQPGEVVRVDPVKAAPFVERGILRPVNPPAVLIRAGQIIEWDSPLFGRIEGRVTAHLPDNMVEVDHPITGERAVIPGEWARGIPGEKS